MSKLPFLKSLSEIILLMIAFWAAILVLSWVLAVFYRNIMLSFLPGLFSGEGADIVMWIGVVLIFGFVLFLFKKLFYRLFWFRIVKV